MFDCKKCGMCCRNLTRSAIYKNLDRGDGVCKYLDNNICIIYNDRPIICRIDDFYDIFCKDKITIDEYYKLNYAACEKLQKM